MAKSSIDTALLYSVLDAARREKDLSWRMLAADIGVSPSLLSRLGNDLTPDTKGFASIVTWLGMPAETFITGDGSRASKPDSALMAEMSALLRASKDLSEIDVTYLEEVIAATVKRARAQGT